MSGIMPESTHRYDEEFTYSFTKDDEAAMATLYEQILDSIASIGDHDGKPYQENSELYQKEAEFEERFMKYYNAYGALSTQVELAYLQYYIDTSDSSSQQYLYASNLLSEVKQKYISLFRLIYDSNYREYFYYGWSEEKIQSVLEKSDNASDELTELNKTINETITAYYALENPSTDPKVLDHYETAVSAYNQIAKLQGYDNYLSYVYKNDFGREYTYQDAHTVADYIKKYISPSLTNLIGKYWVARSALTTQELQTLNTIINGSFFENTYANQTVNSFLDEISGFGEIDFANIFEDVMKDGNYFLGNYGAAYTSSISTVSVPYLYFGEGYRSPSTVVHEFGHYNFDYRNGPTSASYDLYETHSQGLEMLYFNYMNSYLQTAVSKRVADTFTAYQLASAAQSAVRCMTVNMFEEAVYTNTYTGTYSEQIMADGKISKDEYDLLYNGICSDYNLSNSTYWRYTTLENPGYYVSYAVSGLVSMQLYTKAENSSLSAATQSYVKLMDFYDENPDYTYAEVLTYAGLHSYTDEALYIELSDLFNK
jgi:hypothetical protein